MPASRPTALARALTLLGALAGSACAGASATGTLLHESRPLLRRYDGMRADLAERDARRGLAPAGGCPVCQW